MLFSIEVFAYKSILRIRKPFDSYDKELLEEGYPEASQHLKRLLAVKKESGERDTTLINDKDLMNHTMDCFKFLEKCERDKSKSNENDSRIRLHTIHNQVLRLKQSTI